MKCCYSHFMSDASEDFANAVRPFDDQTDYRRAVNMLRVISTYSKTATTPYDALRPLGLSIGAEQRATAMLLAGAVHALDPK